MATNMSGNFSYGGKDLIDIKLFLSKTEMLNEQYDNIKSRGEVKGTAIFLPDKYVCICKDDGQLYTYDSSREANETTGKFRLLETGTIYTFGDGLQEDGGAVEVNTDWFDENYHDRTKQDKLTAGNNITIDENNVISAEGGSGEPEAYIKNAVADGNTLTLTKKDDTTVVYTPEGTAGKDGKDGKDGNSIRVGGTAPESDPYCVMWKSDYTKKDWLYLDSYTYNLYQLYFTSEEQDGNWNLIGNIKGTTGDQGIGFITSTEVPTSQEYANGTLCLVTAGTAKGNIYKKWSDPGIWLLQCNINGTDGVNGNDGNDGKDGKDGLDGIGIITYHMAPPEELPSAPGTLCLVTNEDSAAFGNIYIRNEADEGWEYECNLNGTGFITSDDTPEGDTPDAPQGTLCLVTGSTNTDLGKVYVRKDNDWEYKCNLKGAKGDAGSSFNTISMVQTLNKNLHYYYIKKAAGTNDAKYKAVLVSGTYPYYNIVNDATGDTKLTEAEAKEYMLYMTGSDYLPQYNMASPKNCMMMTADFRIVKPQWSATGGLRLYIVKQLAEVPKLSDSAANGTYFLQATKDSSGVVYSWAAVTTTTIDSSKIDL